MTGSGVRIPLAAPAPALAKADKPKHKRSWTEGRSISELHRQSFPGVLLEIMHQDDALAELVEPGHHRLDDLLRRGALLEVEGIEIGGEHRDIAGAEIGHDRRIVLKLWEAKERRRVGAE